MQFHICLDRQVQPEVLTLLPGLQLLEFIATVSCEGITNDKEKYKSNTCSSGRGTVLPHHSSEYSCSSLLKIVTCQYFLVVIIFNRPIARVFRREVTWVSDVHVWMYKHARLGGCRGMFPLEIYQKLDALRLLLRPFWDRSRDIVATMPIHSIASSFCLSIHLLCQLTLNFHERSYSG